MASSLPEELVQEILVRLPPDEPVHLARASLVCKSWHRVLSDRDSFVRRCRGFHGAPPLLGYIQNRYRNSYPLQFVPVTTSDKTSFFPISMPAVDYSRWSAVDCRHGRVLIHFTDTLRRGLVVWDTITGSQQHLSVPFAYPRYNFIGAVLCAKDGCDHLDCDCQADGPFRVVFVQTCGLILPPAMPALPCASSYSSLTGVWSDPVLQHIDGNYICHQRLGYRKQSLLIGDVIYFSFEDCATSILKYDLTTHWLSEVDMPLAVRRPILIKAEDGGLGLVSLSNNRIHIYIWSQQDDVTISIIGGWVEHRAVELETLLPRRIPYESYEVVGFAEGTDTIFVNISTEIFTFDLKTNEVKKVGEREAERTDCILPYRRFYTPS